MENPIYKAYEKLDNAIMYGADKAANAWNWTTGRTKADLANKLQTVAPIFEVAGFTMSINPLVALLIAPLSLLSSHIRQKKNINYEELERESVEKGALDFEVERERKDNKIFGPYWVAFGGIQALYSLSSQKYESSIGHASVATGFFARSSSHYIMRTRYLPPRKNCLSRAKDKLEEILQERVLRPAPAPMPAPALDYLSLDYKNLDLN